MTFKMWMIKQALIHSCHRVLSRNKEEQTIGMYNGLHRSLQGTCLMEEKANLKRAYAMIWAS